MADDDLEPTDDLAEDRIVGDPVRVLGRYLDQAETLSVACSALREQLGEAPPFSRYEVLHAALEIGLTTLEAMLPEAGHGGGEPVLEVQSIRLDVDVGTILRCASVPADRKVPGTVQLPRDRTAVEITHEIRTPEAYTIIAARNAALERLVPKLQREVPFPLLAPAPTASWVAIAGDLDANRQAPHSTRRSATRRAEHFVALSREREKQRWHMLGAMLASRANDGEPVHPAERVTTFFVQEGAVRSLLDPTMELPLVMAMTAIQRSSLWKTLCERLDEWRAGPQVHVGVATDSGDKHVGLKISRVLHTRRFRYEYVAATSE